MIRTKQVRAKILLALSVLLVAAAAVLLLAWDQGSAGTAEAQEPTAGMSLGTEGISCDDSGCRVPPNSPFRLTISADPPPDVDFSGFAAEVFFDGLVWTKRSACASEVLVLRVDGEPPAICTGTGGPVGQARYLVSTGVPPPMPLIPFEALSSGDTLIELDVACPAAGTYDVSLTAVSGEGEDPAAFGAVYFAPDTTPIFVETAGTRDIDLDGDTTKEDVAVADTLEVTCAEAPPEPTPTEPEPTVVSPPEDLSPVVAADTGTGGAGGDSAGLWATISALLAAAAASLGILGWRFARSRA